MNGTEFRYLRDNNYIMNIVNCKELIQIDQRIKNSLHCPSLHLNLNKLIQNQINGQKIIFKIENYFLYARLEDIDAEMFVLNDSETVKIDDVKKVLMGRLLCDSDEFEWLKKNLPPHKKVIQHRYQY